MKNRKELPHFLADTWWYGLTDRIDEERFKKAADTRSRQGFTAIQLVMGIPPEIAADNKNAFGDGVPALDKKGVPQQIYIDHALKRLNILNKLGLTPIIYGAWGNQIDLIGQDAMVNWWKTIVSNTEQYSPIYCLTGEIDLSAKLDNRRLDILKKQLIRFKVINKYSKAILSKLIKYSENPDRKLKWDMVFDELLNATDLPIICHTTPSINSSQSLTQSDKLSALTVQTGHSESSRNQLWRLPMEHTMNGNKLPFINLEPWYEGINDSFIGADQHYAYWCSMLSGAHSYCYGAQGIWNVGDGDFLSHWGQQTFNNALNSETPRKIGCGHAIFSKARGLMGNTKTSFEQGVDGQLKLLCLSDDLDHSITFYPRGCHNQIVGLLYSTEEAKFLQNAKKNIQMVEFNGFSKDSLTN